MSVENFRWLAGVIAEHPERTVQGRTRLQKTIKLLQRLGLPTCYSYRMHFFGPYSEDLQAEIGLLEVLGFIEDKAVAATGGGSSHFVASEVAVLNEIEPFRAAIGSFSSQSSTVLELAATYDAWREEEVSHKESLEKLHAKKEPKCTPENVQAALQLLQTVGLPNN